MREARDVSVRFPDARVREVMSSVLSSARARFARFGAFPLEFRANGAEWN
jgi:hypothetical protein